MDIIASKHAVEFARNWVTEGNGPLLMEFVTYRYGGHSYASLFSVRFVRHCSCDFIGCPIPVRPIVRVRKSSGCGARKTRSVGYNGTLKSGVSLPSKSSRYVFILSPRSVSTEIA